MSVFIAVDGIDGSGKTTLVRQLTDLLGPLDRSLLVTTKEPTDLSPWGRTLRQSAKVGRMSRDKEIEFFHLDRLFHIRNVIQPALDKGKIVISDRYVDSTLAFQSETPEAADALYEFFRADILIPDVTLILKCPVAVGLQRIRQHRGSVSRFEDIETLEKARIIYETRWGQNYVLIDASGSIEETLNQVLGPLADKFSELADQLEDEARHAGRLDHLCGVMNEARKMAAGAGS